MTLAVVILFITFCPLVMKILTAGKYMAAVPYARIFAWVSVTSSIYYIINDYSIARGWPSLYMITTIIGTIAIIFLMPLFIGRFSYYGGAMMNVFSFIILFLINLILIYVKHILNSKRG